MLKKQNIHFQELYSDLQQKIHPSTKITNNSLSIKYELNNMTFSNLEYQFKFKPDKLKALSNHNFDDIVDTTKKEIQNIFQHNGHSFEVTKEEASRKPTPISVPITLWIISSILIALPSLLSTQVTTTFGTYCVYETEDLTCNN